MCHRWWRRGERAPGTRQIGYQWAYIFSAVRPDTGDDVTLALLPPYSPELNPVERVWLYLRERFLSLRVLDDTEAIIDACCQAWIDLIAEPDRMRTLCAYPWIMKVIS